MVELPKDMSFSDADEYCRQQYPGYRFWFCRPPTFKHGSLMIAYDYYIVVLTKVEMLGLRSLFYHAEVAGFTRQSLRVKGLINQFDELTVSGKYVAQAVIKYAYI